MALTSQPQCPLLPSVLQDSGLPGLQCHHFLSSATAGFVTPVLDGLKSRQYCQDRSSYSQVLAAKAEGQEWAGSFPSQRSSLTQEETASESPAHLEEWPAILQQVERVSLVFALALGILLFICTY